MLSDACPAPTTQQMERQHQARQPTLRHCKAAGTPGSPANHPPTPAHTNTTYRLADWRHCRMLSSPHDTQNKGYTAYTRTHQLRRVTSARLAQRRLPLTRHTTDRRHANQYGDSAQSSWDPWEPSQRPTNTSTHKHYLRNLPLGGLAALSEAQLPTRHTHTHTKAAPALTSSVE